MERRYPSQKDKEWDFGVIAFDGFHEFLENLENQSKDEKEKGKMAVEILMHWVAKNVNNTHTSYLQEKTLSVKKF